MCAPTADLMTWIIIAGSAMIPMGLILFGSIYVTRRIRLEYFLHRAVGLGMFVGLVSVILVWLVCTFIFPEFISPKFY